MRGEEWIICLIVPNGLDCAQLAQDIFKIYFMDIELFQQRYKRVKEVNLKEIDRTDDFGSSVNFPFILDKLNTLIDYLFLFVDKGEVSTFLPESVQNSISTYLNRIIQIIDRIGALNKENLISNESWIVTELKNLENDAKQNLNAHLFAASYEDFEQFLEKEFKGLHQITNKLTDDEKKAREIVAKLERFEEQGGQLAAKGAIVELETAFSKATADADSLAFKWIITAIVLALLIVAVVLWGYILASGTSVAILFGQEFEIQTSFLFRILLITLLATGLKFSTNNYKTAKHLSVVNSFRSRVMNTIERVLSWQGMPEDFKRDLLKDASGAIFHLNDSGYLFLNQKDGKGVNITLPSADV